MKELPPEVEDEEAVVRVVIDKWLKNGKVHRPAFQPKKGKSGEISVIRHDFTGSDFCKLHGKTKVQKLTSPNSRIYTGLAATKARAFREEGGNVYDTREQFLGHADACIGIVRPDTPEPPEPEVLHALNRRIDALLSRTSYFPDPEPQEDKWVGDEVIAP